MLGTEILFFEGLGSEMLNFESLVHIRLMAELQLNEKIFLY